MTKEMVKTNVGPNEEGLRILARIIARIHARDTQNKTAMEAEEQLQKEQGNSGKAA